MSDSKDLPITEYWDPEWDVYDVPLSPFEGNVDHEIWWAAYEHTWILDWILMGEAAYIPFRFDHQLTTGADRVPDVCRCRTELVDGGSQYGVAHVRDPRCTIHPGELSRCPVAVRPPACICRYGVARVDGAPGPWAMFEPFGRYPGRRWGTRCFQIDPRCVHHGDRICLHDWEQFWDGSLGYSATDRCMACGDYRPTPKGASAWVTLDDAERRGE